MKELILIQNELHVTKDRKGHNYDYRKVDDILSAVKKIAPENVYVIMSDDIVCVGGHNYMKATATIYNADSSCSASAFAKEGKLGSQSDPQISGSCSTYARKKALEGLFALDNDEFDPDDRKESKSNDDDVTLATDEDINILKDYSVRLENVLPDKAKYITDRINSKKVTVYEFKTLVERSIEYLGEK